MKSAFIMGQKNTMVEIVTWKILKESLKMRKSLKRPNKLDRLETKRA